MLVSICIPCYRSAKTLPIVVQSVKEEFQRHPEYEYEFVLVNDGSPDATFATIRELADGDDRIIGVDLSRNYGQAAAKLAALPYATGDIVIFMDDDGQHPADGIFKLIDKMHEGDYDVVYAHLKKKKTTAFKKITSNLHNWIAEGMGNKPKGIHRSSFTAWSRTIADAMKNYQSPFISIGAYVTHLTTKFADVEIDHVERLEGTSGYSLKKLVHMWLNIFFSFSMLPLRVASSMGSILAIVGFIWGIVLVIRKIVNPAIPVGYTSTIVLLLVIGGLIMMFLGIIGEFLGRTYMTVSNMPQYNVRNVIGAKRD